VKGECRDGDHHTFSFEGEWNNKIFAQRLGKQNQVDTPYEKNYIQYDWLEEPNEEIPNFPLNESVLVWKKTCALATEKPYSNWDMTNLACEAIIFDEKYYITLPLPPLTDSRQRLDRIALEKLDFDTAAIEKDKLETKQRKERHDRDAQEIEWEPSFFEVAQIEGLKYYKYKHNYPLGNNK
jgi:hypothetical protein